MDYEQKYKEALSWIQSLYYGLHGKTKEEAERYFPELKKSKDERVKKAITHILYENYTDAAVIEGVEIAEIVDWLEKQGEPAKLSEEEQNRFAKGVLTSCALSFMGYLDTHRYKDKMCLSNKECEDIENAFYNSMWDKLHRYYCKYIEKQGEKDPCIGCTNDKGCVTCENGNLKEIKIEPKFKVGDWIKHNETKEAFLIKGIGKTYYMEDIYGIENIPIDIVDELSTIWTIEDIKDGDILFAKGIYFKEYIFIYSGMTNDNVISTYCGFDMVHNNFDTKLSRFGRMEDFEAVHPATKEQHDLLFQKMKEKGYEWDFVKKELKKIEQ